MRELQVLDDDAGLDDVALAVDQQRLNYYKATVGRWRFGLKCLCWIIVGVGILAPVLIFRS